ncbi:MAG TPA: patatin-like phospholipase family protein [Caulobacteraceae bacterium]|nr:patatin-like phospholipase family protein [Caulobacteraceae bacterium]
MALKLCASAVMLCVSACASLPRAGFSATEAADASPPGFANVLFDEDSPVLVEGLRRDVHPDATHQLNVLALSGGGANGAYGAGVLYGWSRAGDRPDFQVVTGVSVGALIATFAFAGSAWDERLRQAFDGAETAHILKGRGVLGLITPGLFSKARLTSLVDRYVDEDLIRAVAAEHAKGRRLLVATTNLDSERLVVWDMGAIAAHGGPEARRLFQQVLVASVGIPGIFSPSLISVETGGRRFSEMHVDGQVIAGFLAVFHSILLADEPIASREKLKLYVLVNGGLDGRFNVTVDQTIPVVARSLEAGAKAALRSELIATTDFCRRNGLELEISQLTNVAQDRPLDFGEGHVHQLFEEGVAASMAGSAWRTPDATPAIVASGSR